MAKNYSNANNSNRNSNAKEIRMRTTSQTVTEKRADGVE